MEITIHDLIEFASIVLGAGGVGAIVSQIITARAKSEKSKADTVAVYEEIVASSAKSIIELQSEVARLRAQLDGMEIKYSDIKSELDRVKSEARVYRRWAEALARQLTDNGIMPRHISEFSDVRSADDTGTDTV